MRFQSAVFLTALFWSPAPGWAQEVSQTATPTVIRTETRVVLVDSVVMDKKGNYVPDLTQKDFKVYEDGKEQTITSFTYEADPNSPLNNQKHYLVLFFDNASVNFANQSQARAAAQKFVDSNTGPTKFIAVVNFSGALQITQNFTNDADRLRAVISGVKPSNVNTSDAGMGGAGRSTGGGPATLSAAAQFGIRDVLLGLRSLAKGLSDVPGRKMVVMLTSGFPLNSELRSELTATIDACNKSNVSIYPVDVRGLVAPSMPNPGAMPGRGGGIGHLPMALLGTFGGTAASLSLASFTSSFQARGGGAPSTGSGSGSSAGAGAGAAGGGRGGTGTASGPAAPSAGTGAGGRAPSSGTPSGGTPTAGRGGRAPGNSGGGIPVNPNNNPMNNANRMIMPPMPPGMRIGDNQEVLYALANGTGGFVIVNTNDLLGGMEKIVREQDQYYVIGFRPAESAEGSCHSLKVKVAKGGENVRSRSGYCNVRQVDVLAGKPAETELEAIAVGVSAGKLGAPLQLPYFYASPNVARVNVAMEIPTGSFKFTKVKGKDHAEMNVLGIAYRADNTVGAKFSDTIKLDYENKTQIEEFSKHPLHYENQFDIASGAYNVKVVFSAGGENFGKIEKPLNIEPYDGKEFAVSAISLGELHKTEGDTSMDVLIEDKVPLVALGVQEIPAGQYAFKTTDQTGVYMEVYDPALTSDTPPKIQVAIRITDRKTGEQKIASGNMAMDGYVRTGNPMVPIMLKLPMKDLPVGSYKLEMAALDTSGKTMTRSADFEIEAATGPAVGWGKN